jgi:hypothetical protein
MSAGELMAFNPTPACGTTEPALVIHGCSLPWLLLEHRWSCVTSMTTACFRLCKPRMADLDECPRRGVLSVGVCGARPGTDASQISMAIRLPVSCACARRVTAEPDAGAARVD